MCGSSRAPTDVAAPMLLGTTNGGLEVDGHAARRPAPTGLFASLGPLDSANAAWLDRLAGFLRRTRRTCPTSS